MSLLSSMLAAANRLLNFYNGDEYNAGNLGGMTGPGGMANNWDACIQDIGAVGAGVGDALSAVSTSAGNAAASASSAAGDAITATNQAAIAVAAANTAAGISLIKQPSEIAGIDPVLDFPFRSASAVPAGVITGSSGKWVFNQAGVLVNVPSGTAPIGFDPTTSALRGIRAEEARTNLILGSDAPSTQAVAVTAQAYTLSFYGTGTVTLSGTYSGSAVGTGAFPSQKTLTFTPTAGTLTLTISGTVQYAQLEAGSLVTSYIKTVGSTVTRAADVNTLLLSSIPGWNASEGTIYVETMLPQTVAATRVIAQVGSNENTDNVRIWVWSGAPTTFRGTVYYGGVTQSDMASGTVTAGSVAKLAISFKANSFAFSANGGAAVTGSSGSLPTMTTLGIGAGISGGGPCNGFIRRLTVFPRALSSATLPLLTA